MNLCNFISDCLLQPCLLLCKFHLQLALSLSPHSLPLPFPCRQLLLFAIANPILVVCQIPNSFALSLPVTSFTINSSSCKNKFNSISGTQNLCRPPNKQTTNRRTNMCERERERGSSKKEEKLSVEKITKLAFKFLLAFCSLQSKQIDSSKRTKPLPHRSLPLLALRRQPQSIDKGGANSAKTSVGQCRAQMLMNADFVATLVGQTSAARKCWWNLQLSWAVFHGHKRGRERGLFCNRFNIKLRSICVSVGRREFKLNRWVQQWIKAVPRREKNPLLMWGEEIEGQRKGCKRA